MMRAKRPFLSMDTAEGKIQKAFFSSAETMRATNVVAQISKAVELLHTCFSAGHKVLLCGNGGSSEQAQHFATELVCRYKKERRSLPAVVLGAYAPLLTAVGNDYAFETIFSRELSGLGKKGDVLVAFSTSGNSKNVLEAVNAAKNLGMKTLGFCGEKGALRAMVDVALCVASADTPRIQETHLLMIHIISDLIENVLTGYEEAR